MTHNMALCSSQHHLANKIGPKISKQLLRAQFKSKNSGLTGKPFANQVEDCEEN